MPEEKSVTLKLSNFLDYILGRLDHVTIDKPLADLLKIVDPDEQFIHIQDARSENIENPEIVLTRPLLWNIKAWRSSYKHREDIKADSALCTSALSKLHDNIEQTARQLRVKTRMPKEACVDLARELVLKGDHEALKAWGITIVERTPEELKALNVKTLTMM